MSVTSKKEEEEEGREASAPPHSVVGVGRLKGARRGSGEGRGTEGEPATAVGHGPARGEPVTRRRPDRRESGGECEEGEGYGGLVRPHRPWTPRALHSPPSPSPAAEERETRHRRLPPGAHAFFQQQQQQQWSYAAAPSCPLARPVHASGGRKKKKRTAAFTAGSRGMPPFMTAHHSACR